MSFKRINNLTGWAICLIASTVYLMTMEATGSFWDCGEFASSCFKVQVPHPPGAPLFVLMGRIFTIPFSMGHNGALGVNTMSALASGFTILFLFWSITHFARKIILKNGGTLTSGNIFAIMAAGVVGALAYTFSDSFWYSAVEAEVYACSSFFTAIVFWAILKWEQEVTEENEQGITGKYTRADRWLILIFYLIGLAVGVHLLNLLTIPAIVMVYYFKRYNATPWGTFFAFMIGCVITGVVQVPILQWTIKNAGSLDIIFKNNFNMPFFYGFGFYFIALAVLIIIGLRFSPERLKREHLVIWFIVFVAFLVLPELVNTDAGLGKKVLIRILLIGIVGAGSYFMKASMLRLFKLLLLCFAFIILGFSTYFTTLIRSNADPAIDMFNVDNPVSLVGYLSREQYGDWPVLYGQDFTSEATEQKWEDVYIKTDKGYEKKGKKLITEYNPEDLHFFPRMWDASNDQSHADYYAQFAGIGKDSKGKYQDKPTMGDNINFFISYQFNWMFWRYFMWNFAGKQNDIQGADMGNVRDGNWKTGISFWDNARLGDQSKLPETLQNNKANNKLFALPFILGILGLVYHIKRDKRDALVVGLLFFFTGFAIILYLNQAGNQPRERDYAYVGSFYAFAIWIGLGVLYVREMLTKYMNSKMANYVSAGVCTLAVPVLMGCQEWDDHDRSNKTIARDLAIDYLESCPKNAILITFGDNDTYPLWYAQEVEGIRRDIRVINSSLMGTDWYLNQLRYKVNESDPVSLIWTPDQILGNKRDGVYYDPNLPGVKLDPKEPMDLLTMLKEYTGSEDPSRSVATDNDTLYVYPTKKVKVPVDINVVRQNGTVNNEDSVLSEITFDIPRNVLGKNESAVLQIIAANNWQRPICFTSPYSDLGFEDYLRTDGLTYRLVPVKGAGINRNWCVDKMLNKFVFGNCDKKGVYYDEENRRHLNTIRMQYGQIALDLVDYDMKEDAKKVLERCDKMMLEENFPYGMPSRRQQHNQISMQFLVAAYRARDTALAKKALASLKKDMEQQITFFNSLDDNKKISLEYENKLVTDQLQRIMQMEQVLNNPALLNTKGNTPNQETDTAKAKPKDSTQKKNK
jgi:hypothetical protein